MLPETFWLFVIPLAYVAVAGRYYIRMLKARFYGQYIREDGPQSHHGKAGTPTMGGMMIIDAVIIGLLSAAMLVGASFFTPELWWTIGITLVFCGLGLTDDWLKVAKKKNKGVSGYTKLAIQTLAGLTLGIYVMQVEHRSTVAVFNWLLLDLGWLYPVFAALVVTGASNAVNLTDGLDGLAASNLIISFLAMAVMLVAGASLELSILSWMFVGACFGFLVYNRHPAQVFMGDTGSLAMGGALGGLAVIGGLEFWLLLVGGIYVLETLSVIIQVAVFKTTGQRFFKMAPLHHHFELSGFSETQVVYYFAGLQAILATLAVFLYKLPSGG